MCARVPVNARIEVIDRDYGNRETISKQPEQQPRRYVNKLLEKKKKISIFLVACVRSCECNHEFRYEINIKLRAAVYAPPFLI